MIVTNHSSSDRRVVFPKEPNFSASGIHKADFVARSFIVKAPVVVPSLDKLAAAISSRKFAKVQRLIGWGADINMVDSEGRTPLTRAVSENIFPMVRLLVNLKADLNKSDSEGRSPLTRAVIKWNYSMVRLLASLKADLNKSDSKGNTPLTRAILDGNYSMVRLLVDLGADLNQSDSEGNTPLTCAVSVGNYSMVRLLVHLGADVNQSDANDGTPLTWALHYRNSAMVKLLVSLKANYNLPNAMGFTPLTWAVWNGERPMVELLAHMGANINKSDNLKGTPLTCAVIDGNYSMVELLVRLGANINKSDGRNGTPLICAVMKHDSAMVELLVRLRADINKIDDEGGGSPLTVAALNGNIAMVKLLKKMGANLDQRDADGSTPLSQAIWKGNCDMITVLKDLGASLDCLDVDGWTALAFSRAIGREETTKLLIRLGADQRLSDECYYQKMMAAAWGLTGFTSLQGASQALDKGSASFGFYVMKEGLTAFFEEESEWIPEEILKKKSLILESFEQAYSYKYLSNAQIVERIKSGKPTLVPGGPIGHVVTFLFYNKMLAICNRGLGRDKESAIAYYRYPEPITEEFVLGLLTKQDTEEAYCEMVRKLGPKITGMGLQQSDQHAGNCYFASPKSALYALANIICPEKAKEFYKRFAAFIRKYVLREYFKNIVADHLNISLLGQVKKKLVSKLDAKPPKAYYERAVLDELNENISL